MVGFRRTKGSRGSGRACVAGGCRDAENLNAQKPLRAGTETIRQECRMHSRLSVSQAQCVKHFACPARRGF